SLVVAFWLLLEWPAIRREFKRLIPESRKEDAEMIGLTISRAMNGFIRATIIQCLLIGGVAGLSYVIIGVSYSGPLAVIVGLFNVIPVVGHWIGLILVTVVAFFQSPIIGLIVFLVTLVIQEFVYFFVQPKLMANSVDVHPVLVILAMFIGSSAGGALYGFGGSVAGMLVSIPFAAVAKALFVYYYERKTGLQVVSEDGVFFKGIPSHVDGNCKQPDPCADAIAAPPVNQGATARLFKPADLKRLIDEHASKDAEENNNNNL
ncbi:MAG: AI-2E family transporter, partial [Eggerthellaceae bacterium]|nr:AI-2E family transporter [Eggerthellaceae bacterium]